MSYLKDCRLISEPDGVLRCSDGIDLKVHKQILGWRSGVLDEAFQYEGVVPVKFSSVSMDHILNSVYERSHQLPISRFGFYDKYELFEIVRFFQIDKVMGEYENVLIKHFGGWIHAINIDDYKFVSENAPELAMCIDKKVSQHMHHVSDIFDLQVLNFLECDASNETRLAWMKHFLISDDDLSEEHLNIMKTTLQKWWSSLEKPFVDCLTTICQSKVKRRRLRECL